MTSTSSSVRPARSSALRTAGTGPMPMMLGLDAAGGPGEDPRADGRAELLRRVGGDDDDGRGGVVDARGVASGDGAVLLEGGPEFGKRLGGDVASDVLVAGELDRLLALALIGRGRPRRGTCPPRSRPARGDGTRRRTRPGLRARWRGTRRGSRRSCPCGSSSNGSVRLPTVGVDQRRRRPCGRPSARPASSRARGSSIRRRRPARRRRRRAWIAWAAETIACTPVPHRRLTVKAGASLGTPALMPTTRAMYMSSGAVWMTLPNTTWSTCSGSSRARSIAARAAVAPSSVVRDVSQALAEPSDCRPRRRGDHDVSHVGASSGCLWPVRRLRRRANRRGAARGLPVIASLDSLCTSARYGRGWTPGGALLLSRVQANAASLRRRTLAADEDHSSGP